MVKCIHCLTERGPFNEDHVFPSAWYPENTPQEIQKPTAPTCYECNNLLSKIEEKLLRVFSFGFSPSKLGHKKIYEKMKRSISESAGKNEKDKKSRAQVRDGFYQKFLPAKNFHADSIINPNNEEINTESMGMIFSEDDLDCFLKKISKGLIYNFGKVKYVPSIYVFSFFHFQSPPSCLKKFSHVKRAFGPGFNFSFWEDPEFPPNSIIQIQIWQNLNFWITIENPTLTQKKLTLNSF